MDGNDVPKLELNCEQFMEMIIATTYYFPKQLICPLLNVPVSGELPKPHKSATSELSLNPKSLFRTSKVAEAPTSATFSFVNENSKYGTLYCEYVLPSAF